MSSVAALSYHEPGTVTILVLASFLLLENVVNWACDRLLFCGLVGQIAIGVAWGIPGADWLSEGSQTTIVQIGYLGLILLVFEGMPKENIGWQYADTSTGGLSTDLKTLRSNLLLSSLVAVVGISAPIGLSFVLPSFVNGVTPVQAFAAGAALCSTSLGTTFTILSTSGLNTSRLGVVLSSAAMMDDIVGLVMSGIIASLGTSSDFSAITVIRPVFVSIAFATVVPLFCLWVLKPLTNMCYKTISWDKEGRIQLWIATENAALVLQVLVLSGLVTAAGYAGTSNLFAAYLAGALITWWDAICRDLRASDAREHAPETSTTEISVQPSSSIVSSAHASKGPVDGGNPKQSKRTPDGDQSTISNVTVNESEAMSPLPPGWDRHAKLTGTAIFQKYFSAALQTILKPFFFASIGFAIPISQMFVGAIIWRGMVYTVLMIIAKLLCGLFLIRFAGPVFPTRPLMNRLSNSLSRCWPWPVRTSSSAANNPSRQSSEPQSSTRMAQTQISPPSQASGNAPTQKRMKVDKPVSLYPAALLGSAMVARGEIGFLISSVAESDGVFRSKQGSGSSELFLIVTWAILLCTLLGPIAVGLMVKRVKRLQAVERSEQTGKDDPLGIWGMIPTAQQAT